MTTSLDKIKQSTEQLNEKLNSPTAQGALAATNAIASFACFWASRKNDKLKRLYQAAGGILATFAGYHIYKAVRDYRRSHHTKEVVVGTPEDVAADKYFMPPEKIGPRPVCLFCKKYSPTTGKCSLGKGVLDPRKTTCDEWRYCA